MKRRRNSKTTPCRIAVQWALLLSCLLTLQVAEAQDNALVVANSKTRQFRHIKMNRWIVIKLKGGNRFQSWFMKGVNDSSIVMAHGHVIRFDEITNLREITEMHVVLRIASPVFFVPFGIVAYAVGMKEGKATPVPRQIASYALSAVCGIASIVPWVVQPKIYDFSSDWYLSSGTMPKKLLKKPIKQPKGDGS